jgi:prevent-host-death family protein
MVNLISALSRGDGMAKTLPISEAKMKLGELVASLEAGDEEVIITRNGRPAAVLLATEAYEALQETLALLSNPETMNQIRRAKAYFDAGHHGLSLDEVFPE